MWSTQTRVAYAVGVLAVACVSAPASASASESDVWLTPAAEMQDFVQHGDLVAVDAHGDGRRAEIVGDGEVAIDDSAPVVCSWYTFAVPIGGAWYTSVDGCSLVGFDGSSRHQYAWVVDPRSNGTACLQGRGYVKNGVSWQERYEGLGCGKDGGASVVIGNVITNAKVKGQSIGASGTAMRWQ